MFLDFLCKKKIKQIAKDKKKMHSQIKAMESNKKMRERAYKSELHSYEKFYDKLKSMLDNQSDNDKCFVEKTKKGLYVFTFINESKHEIRIFDFDSIANNEKGSLVLFFRDDGDSFFIQNIQGGKSQGHGELAVLHLIELAKKEGKEFINGQLSYIDIEKHKDRLDAFYTKMGFEIQYSVDGSSADIKRKIL